MKVKKDKGRYTTSNWVNQSRLLGVVEKYGID